MQKVCARESELMEDWFISPMEMKKEITKEHMPTHTEAVKLVLEALVNPKTGAISSLDEIGAVGHRIVHGGEAFTESTSITDEVIAAVERVSELAPLHNPANPIGIEACQKLMPGVPMAAVFDTAFHQTMPAEAYMYGIPYKYYSQFKVRKYGFHGTSHSYVSKHAADMLGQPYDSLKTIVCHLGNGASVCAVKNGKSVDTSMGLTPLEGLVMGTRSGDIDPSVIEYIAEKENFEMEHIMDVLNKNQESMVFQACPAISVTLKPQQKQGMREPHWHRMYSVIVW